MNDATTQAPQREKSGVGRLVVSTATNDLVIPVAEIDWLLCRPSCRREGPPAARDAHVARCELDARHFARVHRSAIVQLDRVRELRTTPHGYRLYR